MAKPRRFTGQFKAKVALEALRGEPPAQDIAAKYGVHPNRVSTWKEQAVDGLNRVFSDKGKKTGRDHEAVRDLPSAEDQRAASRASDQSVPSLGLSDRPPKPGLVHDITYIPVQRGFLYLVAIMDWYSRKVLDWRLSNTMHADFCVEALKEAAVGWTMCSLDDCGVP